MGKKEKKQKASVPIYKKRGFWVSLAIFFTFGGFIRAGWFIVAIAAIILAVKTKPAPKETNDASVKPPQATAQPVIRAVPVAKANNESFYLDIDASNLRVINNMCSKNFDYSKSKADLIEDFQTDERIYEYDFFEKNASLHIDGQDIVVTIDNKNIGRVKSINYEYVESLIKNDKVKKAVVSVYGGKYKIVNSDDFGLDLDKVKYSLEKDETDRVVKLSLTLK